MPGPLIPYDLRYPPRVWYQPPHEHVILAHIEPMFDRRRRRFCKPYVAEYCEHRLLLAFESRLEAAGVGQSVLNQLGFFFLERKRPWLKRLFRMT